MSGTRAPLSGGTCKEAAGSHRWPAALAAAALLAGCAHSGEIPAAPPPHRPKAVEVKKSARAVRHDCQPTNPTELPAAMAYRDRSIIESDNLAKDGVALLKESEDRQLPRIDREDRFTRAVDQLLKALAADPYNVHATYNLAAAYARIGRRQCAVNLLARLADLRRLASQQAEVERHLDRLLGRNKYRGNLDPDFDDLRDDAAFREVVKKF